MQKKRKILTTCDEHFYRVIEHCKHFTDFLLSMKVFFLCILIASYFHCDLYFFRLHVVGDFFCVCLYVLSPGFMFLINHSLKFDNKNEIISHLAEWMDTMRKLSIRFFHLTFFFTKKKNRPKVLNISFQV